MSIRFTKMHGLGNDFMVVDAIRQSVNFKAQDIQKLASRHCGVGFDQLLLLEPSEDAAVDFNYRIYNADGSEVGQCGNGARCLGRFIEHYGFSKKRTLKIATRTTKMTLHLQDNTCVTLELPTPQWSKSPHTLTIGHHACTFYTLDIGNPHAVLRVEDILRAPVEAVGHSLSTHPFFPHQCNIGFMQILNPHHIQCRIYERGCGETKACGSGAIAAAAIGQLFYQLDPRVTVSLTGGDLEVHWPEKNSTIYLTGPTSFVYEGILL